ncbi:MAG: ribonuclease R [Rubritalea sp.]|jgi:ribonuclease R
MKDIRDRILGLMKSESYQPMDKSEFSRALNLQSPQRPAMRSTLDKLERDGVIESGKKERYSLAASGAENTSSARSGGKVSAARAGKASRPRSGGKASAGGMMVGVIRFQNGGNAWFYPDIKNEDNIAAGLDLDKFDRVFVQSYDTGLALDGDRVSVSVKLPKPPEPRAPKHKGENFKGKKGGRDRRGKGAKGGGRRGRFDDEAKGKVKNVIERMSNVILGTFRAKGKFRYVEPDFSGFQASLELVDEEMGAKSGQRVVVELVRWDSKSAPPVGRITKVLGWPEDPGVDIESVISKHSLRAGFSSEVKAEAMDLLASLQGGVTEAKEGEESPVIKITDKELERREDWRDKLVLTVDPDDAKDFDDAIAVKLLKDGGWELAVHIADVSHYIKPGSALDDEAVKRGNSTYLVDRVLPMLPVQISNNICSLRPEVDRLTKCAVMTFDKNGTRTSSRFCDAVIHSKARLAYEQAQVLLGLPMENADKIKIPKVGQDVLDGLKLAWELASVLRKRRFSDGALDLEFEETKIVLDDKLKAVDVVDVVHNESHQMVEECMLAANEAVAVALKMQRKSAIYRIHEDPDFDKLNEFAEKARAQGYKVGDLTNKKHIQELLAQVKGTTNEESIKIGLLKSLKRAAYSTDAFGHYGLAKMDYCHFTSPIRRYADLVVHRALQSLLVNPPEKPDRNPKLKEIIEIATHISDTERKSAEAEMETKRMKMMEYLVSIQDDGGGKVFTALVTDIRHMGLFVEISSMRVKGLVKVEDLPGKSHDKWHMDGLRYVSSSGHEIKLGEKVKVQIVRVDLERKMVDFRIVDNS